MARARQIRGLLKFSPPTILEGIGQVIDLYGQGSCHTQPPRIIYAKRANSAVPGTRHATSIAAAFARDLKAVGSDLFASCSRHHRRVRQNP